MKMEGSFSPIVKRIAGEVVRNGKRRFQAPTDVYLEDWWLSKPDGVQGIAVSGCPVETRRYDSAQREYNSASTKKRCALREFHSIQVVKRHSCTTIETSDGLFVYLCGFINRSRTRQNGFSSEVCRNFLYGFPIDWEDCAAKIVVEESSQINHDHFSESFLPAVLDAYSSAQLHDMEREILNKQMYDNLMGMLNPETANGKSTKAPSKVNPSFVEEEILQTPNSALAKVKNKWQLETSPQNYNEQEIGESPTSRKRVCRTLEKPNIEETVKFSPKASVKQGLEEKPGKNIQTSSKKRTCTRYGIERNAGLLPEGSAKKEIVDESICVVRKLRERTCKSMTNLKKPQTGEMSLLHQSPRAPRNRENLRRKKIICRRIRAK